MPSHRCNAWCSRHAFGSSVARRFGAKLHYSRLLVDCILMLMLIVLAFWLKTYPESQGEMLPLAVAMLVLMVMLVVVELWTTYLWWQNNQGEGDARVSTWTMFKGSLRFMQVRLPMRRRHEAHTSNERSGARPCCQSRC